VYQFLSVSIGAIGTTAGSQAPPSSLPTGTQGKTEAPSPAPRLRLVVRR